METVTGGDMTMGFQFAHVQWAGKTKAAKRQLSKASHGTERGKGWSAAELLAEASREPGHCSHVEHPMPPTLIFGLPLSEVEKRADAWAVSQTVSVKMKNGNLVQRKMRSDGPVIAAGVISLPRDRILDWPAFRDNAVAQLQKKHGDRLVSAVEHLDEAHPHLHYYLVPLPGESFGAVHDGYAASREARAQPDNKIRSAYNAAMSGWQDWVQEHIAGPFGLARTGPRRERLSRKAWKEDEQRRTLDLREKKMREEEALNAKKAAEIDRLIAENTQEAAKLKAIFDVLTATQQVAVAPKIAAIVAPAAPAVPVQRVGAQQKTRLKQ